MDQGQSTPPTDQVEVTYCGCATLLIRCGGSALLTDGFFTRPALSRVVFGRLAPDRKAIARELESLKIDRLDCVVVGHSHYDHALDAAEVAIQTQAVLVGSPSTAQIAQGWGLPAGRILCPSPHQTVQSGSFKLTLIPSAHNHPDFFPGKLERPLHFPAPASAFREGGSYTILVETPRARFLIQESAGYVPSALNGLQADVAFLSVAGMARLSAANKQAYFSEMLLATGVKSVTPIHWDHFFKPVSENPRFLPRWMEDTRRSIAALKNFCDEHRIAYFFTPIHQTLVYPP